MAEAMQLDAALPPMPGTAILSCLSDDDIDQMVAGLYGNRLSKEQQTSFNQAVAAAYNISQRGLGVEQAHRPEVIMFDEKNRPAWIRLTPTIACADIDRPCWWRKGYGSHGSPSRQAHLRPMNTLQHQPGRHWSTQRHYAGLELGLVASHEGLQRCISSLP